MSRNIREILNKIILNNITALKSEVRKSIRFAESMQTSRDLI